MSRCKDLSRWRPLLPADVISEDASQNVVAADHTSATDDSPDRLVMIILLEINAKRNEFIRFPNISRFFFKFSTYLPTYFYENVTFYSMRIELTNPANF